VAAVAVALAAGSDLVDAAASVVDGSNIMTGSSRFAARRVAGRLSWAVAKNRIITNETIINTQQQQNIIYNAN
jgi:hypothetical protein